MQRYKAERKKAYDAAFAGPSTSYQTPSAFPQGQANIHGRFRYANDTIAQSALWRCCAAAAIFQRSMWREYAMTWKGRKTGTGVDQRWVSEILRVSFAECLQRSRSADGARFYIDAARDFGWMLP